MHTTIAYQHRNSFVCNSSRSQLLQSNQRINHLSRFGKTKRRIHHNTAPFAHSRNGTTNNASAITQEINSIPRKLYDLVTLSNLCVDIVVPTPKLPPADEPSRKALLHQLTANPPSEDAWEVGGNTNTLIAASRLGLHVASIGHIGNDIYGAFLANVLKSEGVDRIVPFRGHSPDSTTTTIDNGVMIVFVYCFVFRLIDEFVFT